MSQSGFTPIQNYSSATASAVPLAVNLAQGELAINTNDGKLFYKDSAGNVQTMASKATGAIGGSTTQVQFNNAGVLGGSASLTWSGTVLTSSGFSGPLNGTVGATTPAAGSFTTVGASGVATFSAGSAAAPAITTSGDTNTGIFFPAADTIAFAEGGAEAMRIDSSGNLGLGVTPSAWASGIKGLQVGANSYASAVDFNNGVTIWGSNYYNDGSNKFANASSRYALQIIQDTTNGAQSWRVSNAAGTAGNAITFTQAMTLDVSGNLGIGTASPTSGLQTAGSSSKSAFKTPNIAETNTVSATAASGTIQYDITTQSVLYYTSNASANWTVNFRGSSGTSLNTVMQTGESISVTFLATQGATAYYNSAVTIDGNSVTPKWQGGSAPTSGNASSIDSYNYVIIKTASATFTVLASVTKFA